VEQAAPTQQEVEQLLGRIVKRIERLMERHGPAGQGAVDEDQDREHEPQLLFASARPGPSRQRHAADALPPRCARQGGYSLEAGAAVHGNDRRGLERLCRYGLRPALSLERLSEAQGGHLVYEMKRTFSDGTRCQRFTPRELLLRLCALVPPPGFHTVRYAGIFSGHARGRHALTGRGLRDDQPGRPRRRPEAHVLVPPNRLLPAGLRLELEVEGADAPWRERRLPWATLLQRVHGIEVLVCPACEGPMRILGFIQDERTARKILDHLGLPSRPPPRGHRVCPGQQTLWRDRAPEGPSFDGIDPPSPD
jgi:hypothetical protein